MSISSKEIEALWSQYSEGIHKSGISVAQYVESNGVPYRTFEKWYQKKFSSPDVVGCAVSGIPTSTPQASSEVKVDKAEAPEAVKKKAACVSYINIGLSNGVKIEHHRLSYSDLVIFIEKLQPLCSA